MAGRPRLPTAKAEVSGSAARSPGRFADRKKPKRARPLGEPYSKMTEEQKEAWHELSYELPWLTSSHRPVVRLVCYWLARLNNNEPFTASDTSALSSLLTKLGATPADESKVNHSADEDEDESDKFFNRSH